MWQGFTIALREGIEAFLIVALTLSYLKRTGRAELSKAVWAAVGVSVLTCAGAGFLFSKAANQSLWEGILALAAAALVGSLLVYMKRVSKHLKRDIETRIESKAALADHDPGLLGSLSLRAAHDHPGGHGDGAVDCHGVFPVEVGSRPRRDSS